MIELTQENFTEEVLQSDKPVLVDFWAEWCAPCRMLAPVFEELARQLGDKVKLGKVNVDTQPVLAMQYQADSIPTVLLFENGVTVRRSIGYAPKEELLAQLGLQN